ncbi:MAG: hypothetical protein JNL58_30950 [Planctomyces sp.]|nr:hypothetical protein [Planctomyces sp.]
MLNSEWNVVSTRAGIRTTGCLLMLAALMLARPGICHAQVELPAGLSIEAYPDRLSLVAGDTLRLHTSTTAASYSVEIARLGASRNVVFQQAAVAGGGLHPIPEHASSRGCGWPVTFELPVPAEWESGYYSVVLKVADGGGQFVGRNRRTAELETFFVVRPSQPGTRTAILLQLSTNTYNAYNNWGGSSLYAFHGRANLQGNRVSFQRPQASQFGNWEHAFVSWAESNGYVLDFCANLDLEQHPELLKKYRLVLSVGHDEYWSKGMRDALEAFITNGGNVAFFSGNTCCWQVRPEEDGQALVCFKQSFNLDPVFRTKDHSTLTSIWSHHSIQRPENQLTGVGFLHGGYHRSHGQFMDGSGAFQVHRPQHWIFEGTGLKQGNEFGGKDSIVGYECDGCELEWRDGLPVATHRDGTPETFEVLATCPAAWAPDDCEWYEKWEQGRVGAACLGVYTRGGTVFTCGSTDWSHGLRGEDPNVTRITRNILDRLGKAAK